MSTADTVKFEEKRTVSASKTKVIKDGFSSEQVNERVICSQSLISNKRNHHVLWICGDNF